MVLYLLSVLLGVCVPESNGAAPSAAHCPHAVGVLLARAEGYQPPTLRMHLGLPGEREERMKPGAPCSGVHSPSTEVTLPLGMWNSREPPGIHCQSMSKVDLGEGQRESKGQHRSQTPTDWKSLEHLS